MDKEKAKIMTRELINKIYNSASIDDEILEEIRKDILKIKKLHEDNSACRELLILIESAKKQQNQIAKNNFKFLLLSDLEKEYRKLNNLEK